MKKLILMLLLSVLAVMSACSLAPKPKVSFCQKARGTLTAGENTYQAEFDFLAKDKTVIIQSKVNPFDLHYTFSEKKVRIDYDELHSEFAVSALPQANPARVLWEVSNVISPQEAKWNAAEKRFEWSGTIGDADAAATVNPEGKIIDISVPAYRFYFKAA